MLNYIHMKGKEIKASVLPDTVTCHFLLHVQERGVMVSTLGKARPNFKDICISVHRFITLVASL